MDDPLNREIEELRVLMGSSRDPDGRVFAQLGNALRRAGRLDEAAEVLETGLVSHPHYTPGHLTLAWVELERGDLGAARTRFGRTLDLDPDNPFGLLGLGRLLELGGNPSGSGMVERALELHPGAESFAPSVPEALRVLQDLPFRSLEELAPSAPWTDDLGDRPFLSIEELAPEPEEPPLSALPFMTLWDLRPADDGVGAEAPDADAPAHSDESVEPHEAPEFDGVAEFSHSAAFEHVMDIGDGAEDAEPAEFGHGADLGHGGGDVEAEGFDRLRDVDEASELEQAGEVEDPEEFEHAGEGEGAEDDDRTEPDETAELDEDAIPVTRTMAELLVRQGLLDRAAGMFRELCQRHPGEGELAARLEEVEAMQTRLGPAPDAGDRTLPPASTLGAGAGDTETGDPETAAEEEPPVHPSLDMPDPGPEAPSPYAWDEDGEEVAEPGAPDASVGAYFGRLLAWTPGNPAREADEATSPESHRGPDSESS